MKSVFFISTIVVIFFIILLAGCSSNENNPVSTSDQGVTIPHVKGESGPIIDEYKDKDFDKFISALKNVGMIDVANALTDNIKASQLEIKNFGFGYTIAGRVVLDNTGDPRDVMAQMEILEDGYFADSVRNLTQPVGFRLHGYMPFDLELNKIKGKPGAVINVGTIHLTSIPAGQLASLKGKVTLDDGFDPTTAKISLYINCGPVNTPTNGIRGREHWPDPVKVAILPNGDFFADGFTPTSYYMEMSGSEHVTKASYINFRLGETLDLGVINLETPKKIKLTYCISVNESFVGAEEKQIVIDGGTRWKTFNDLNWGWDLEFTQKDGKIIFNYSYGNCYIADLGAGDVKDFLTQDSHKDMRLVDANIEAQSGHIYILDQQFFRHWILFKCEF